MFKVKPLTKCFQIIQISFFTCLSSSFVTISFSLRNPTLVHEEGEKSTLQKAIFSPTIKEKKEFAVSKLTKLKEK